MDTQISFNKRQFSKGGDSDFWYLNPSETAASLQHIYIGTSMQKVLQVYPLITEYTCIRFTDQMR